MNDENLIPAKKGEVRNPRGKAKGTKSTKTILEKLIKAKVKQPDLVFSKGVLAQRSAQEWMWINILAIAMSADKKNTASAIAACKEITDRLEGKVIPAEKQPISEDKVITFGVKPKKSKEVKSEAVCDNLNKKEQPHDT